MLHRNIRLLAWFNFFTDFKLYAPVAIIYFSQITGSFTQGMSIFSVAMVSSAIFEIPTGVFSDRIGRRKTVILGAVSAVLYSLFYAIGQSYWILFIGAVLEGLSRSFYSGNNEALLHDTLSDSGEANKYGEFLGKTSSMFQVALAVSAILGGFFAHRSFAIVMWVSIIPQLICLYLAILLIEPKIHSRESENIYLHLKEAYSNFLINKKLRLLSLTSILSYGFAEAGYQFQAAFYGTLWPVWAIGIAKAFSNLSAAGSFYYSGRFLHKFGDLRLLILGKTYNKVINIFSTAFPTILSPLLMSSTSLFYGVTRVAQSSLMQKEFSSNQRATMGSLNSFGGSVFFAVVATSLGFVADMLTPAKAILILNLFIIINLVLYWKLFSHE